MKGAVQRSWDQIQALGTTVVGEHVYRYFFELVPEAMSCFPVHVRLKYREWIADEPDEDGDLRDSAALRNLFAKVLNAIGCTVAGLQDASKLVPLLSSLGARHIGYGVSEEFWPALGKAMNRTLQDLLGEAFTPEVENAWNIVYGFMSQIMVESLRKAREAAQEGAAARSSNSKSEPDTASDISFGNVSDASDSTTYH